MGKVNDVVRVYYDDGAGHTKLLADVEGKPTIRQKIRSMVALYNAGQTFGMGAKYSTVELPSATGKVFGNGVQYTMGDHVAANVNAQLDTTATRYLADPGALVRLYTNLGFISEQLGGLTKFHAEIVAGVATSTYNELHELVQRKLSGQHYFRYNGVEITVEVDSVAVGPQAYYAAQSTIRKPPAKLLSMIKEYPMESNSVVVIDVGDFSTDIALMSGDGKQLAPIDFFSLGYGVGELRIQLANHLLNKGLSPLPSDLDQAITPTSPLFGKVPGKRLGDKPLDVTDTVKTFAQSIWGDVWSAVTRATKNKVGSYYVIVTGGGSIIFAEHIQKSPVDGILFSNHPGMVATGSEWSVVEGMKK